MRRNRLLHLLGGLLFALFSGVVTADDTDIYINTASRLPPGSTPMVMFSLDYRPNLASTACQSGECDTLISEGYMPSTGPYTFFDVLVGALKKVMDPLEGVRVGLMLNHNNNNSCAGPSATGCSNGGYIAMGFEPFLADDANGAKARFFRTLQSIPLPKGDQSHSFQGKELFFEFYRYLTGQGVYNAHNGWTDYGTDADENLDTDGVGHAWDTGIESGSDYDSPLDAAGSCTRIFTVNPLFFVANQEDDSDRALADPVSSGGLGTSPDSFAGVIQYLNDADLADGLLGSAPLIDGKQNVTSYFLVDPTKINTTTIGYAQAGGTGAPLELTDNPDDLVDTLREIFKQVLSLSTTFVAASVPINVFNRAELLGSVHIALFQVDQDAKPTWTGNLKKLKLTDIDGSSVLTDAQGEPAVATDGRIRFDALTYWTVPDALPPPDTSVGEVDGRDGRSVARGGAGQKVPGILSGDPGKVNGYSGRHLYFDDGSSLAPLNVDDSTALKLQTDLGAADAAETLELLAYARGLDIDDLDADGNLAEARQWIFNDPLHSQPLALNYGARGSYTTSNPDVYLAVGSNDGYMRFIRNTTASETESGEEVWAFMPRSTMGAQKVLRANASGTEHPYTVDGAPAAYIDDANHNGTIETGETAYLFFGLRRGGKAYYALDVSNPDSPELLWKIEQGDPGFEELGYTFSTPRIGKLDLGSGPQPVVFFGGGYDTNKDTRGSVGSDDTEGAAIYVVDAETGSLIWKAVGPSSAASGSDVFTHADLVDSIPSTLAIADSDGDLLVDRIVVGDTGGNVWRADLQGADTSAWTLTHLASLGRHASDATGKSDDRRFFHRPDLVPAEDEHGVFDGVVFGTGDRPDPLDIGGVVDNWFYMIKDRNVTKGSATDVNLQPGDLGDVTDNCLQEGSACSVDITNGWKLRLESGGEKALSTPVTIAGTVFFTTYIPPGGSGAAACAPAEGSGRLYAVSLKTAASVFNYDTTVDDPNVDDPVVATTKSDRSMDVDAPGIPPDVVALPPDRILVGLQIETLDVRTRWRTFWYLQEDSDL